jgi:hypothetical protein
MTERHDERVDRVDQRDERIDDLEVSESEARDVAGGKHRPKGVRRQSKEAGIRYSKKES